MTPMTFAIYKRIRLLALDVSLNDDDIVARVCAGEYEMFEVLVLRHRRRVSHASCGILKNSAEVDDVVQETFARAFVKLSQYNGDGRFCSWLMRIAVHEALGRKRQERRLSLEDWVDDELVGVSAELQAPSGGDPERSALKQELCAQLSGAIEHLPEHLYSVFRLRAIEGLSMLEVAEQIGIPPETVKTRFHRAKRRLQEQLREHVPEHRNQTAMRWGPCLLQPTAA